MTPRPYILAETNWKAVGATTFEVAILPWGATEAHNFHLPYATDVMECDHVAAESARVAWEKGAKVIVLPTIPFGVQAGQMDIRLCINMNPSTQAAVLADVVHSLDVQGIRKLVVLNGHGGNDFRQMIRELQPKTRVFLCAVNWWGLGDPRSIFDEPGDHAGELETSFVMHVAPDLVRLEDAGPGTERKPSIRGLREKWAWSPRPWTRVSADTGVGDPRKATAEKGARHLAAVAAQLGEFLHELATTDVERMYE
jgi:creatinine amidohydrolase